MELSTAEHSKIGNILWITLWNNKNVSNSFLDISNAKKKCYLKILEHGLRQK